MNKIGMALFGAVAAAFVFGGGTANAITGDATFLETVHEAGIAADGGDSVLIKTGHQACDHLTRHTESYVVQEIVTNANGLTNGQAQAFVDAAEQAYCPATASITSGIAVGGTIGG